MLAQGLSSAVMFPLDSSTGAKLRCYASPSSAVMFPIDSNTGAKPHCCARKGAKLRCDVSTRETVWVVEGLRSAVRHWTWHTDYAPL